VTPGLGGYQLSQLGGFDPGHFDLAHYDQGAANGSNCMPGGYPDLSTQRAQGLGYCLYLYEVAVVYRSLGGGNVSRCYHLQASPPKGQLGHPQVAAADVHAD